MKDKSQFPAGMSLVLVGLLISLFYFALQAFFQSGFFFGIFLFPKEAIIIGFVGAVLSVALFFAVLLRMRIAFGFLLAGIVIQGLNAIISVEKLMRDSPYGSYALFYYGCISVCFLFAVSFFIYVLKRRMHFFGGHVSGVDDRVFLRIVVFLSLVFAGIVVGGVYALADRITEREAALKDAIGDAPFDKAVDICETENSYFRDACFEEVAVTNFPVSKVDFCDRIENAHIRFKCIIFFAFAEKDKDMCLRLGESGEVPVCRAFVTGNPEECSSLPRADRKLCEELLKTD